MRGLRLTVLTVLALWGAVLAIGLVAQLRINVCSAASVQATILGIGIACLALPFSAWRNRKPPAVLALALVAGIGGALFCTFLGLVPSETVFVFNPSIDTSSTQGFSRTAFLRVEPGMKEAEVIELVGEPAARRSPSNPRAEFDESWGYSQDGACGWCDAAWRSHSVYFRNGTVLKAAEQWHCD